MFINIYRYSKDGFIPKIQTYHYNMLVSYKKPLSFNYPGMNDYQTRMMKELEKEYRPLIENLNLDDWKSVIFVFIGRIAWKILDKSRIKSLKNRRKK